MAELLEAEIASTCDKQGACRRLIRKRVVRRRLRSCDCDIIARGCPKGADGGESWYRGGGDGKKAEGEQE